MNLLDLAILVAASAAAIGGWRLGVMARILAWLGVALGLLVAIPLVAPMVSRFGGSDPDTRVTVALLFLLLCGAAGQALGILAGAAISRRRAEPSLSRGERIGGAGLGAFGVLVVVWMLLPSLAVASGWPARATRDSAIVGIISDRAPTPPDVFDAWGREVADAPYPAALDPLDAPPDPGDPPEVALDAETIASVRPAVVRVTGVACKNVQDGSGVVLAPGTVITNAHVVAGESTTTVIDLLGTEHDAVVIAFDPERDIAVLHAAALDVPPLALSDATRNGVVGVFGFPSGGPLRIAPARVGETIEARGTDIYRHDSSTREVIVLASRLAPGDSGAALIDERRSVVGLAFAIDPGSATTAYALARSEIEAALAEAAANANGPVDTGDCLG